MEYWEFTAYVEGYKDRAFIQQSNIMRLAYYTGMFSNSNYTKPKSLEYYLDQLEIYYSKDKYKNEPVNVEKSKEIYETIQRLKNE